MAAVETEARNRFSDRYPDLKKSFALQHRMIARPNDAPQVSLTQAVHALQFFSQNSSVCVFGVECCRNRRTPLIGRK